MKRDYKKLAEKIAGTIREKKAEDTVALDISSLASFTKIIMLTTARSTVHINTLLRELKKEGPDIRPENIEGQPVSGWVLLDYDGLILNIFTQAKREFYSLERLWGDGEKVNV